MKSLATEAKHACIRSGNEREKSVFRYASVILDIRFRAISNLKKLGSIWLKINGYIDVSRFDVHIYSTEHIAGAQPPD